MPLALQSIRVPTLAKINRRSKKVMLSAVWELSQNFDFKETGKIFRCQTKSWNSVKKSTTETFAVVPLWQKSCQRRNRLVWFSTHWFHAAFCLKVFLFSLPFCCHRFVRPVLRNIAYQRQQRDFHYFPTEVVMRKAGCQQRESLSTRTSMKPIFHVSKNYFIPSGKCLGTTFSWFRFSLTAPFLVRWNRHTHMLRGWSIQTPFLPGK